MKEGLERVERITLPFFIYMKNENNKFELMAPVGDFPTLTSACKAGADAVYFGISNFSMRTGKKNFKISELGKIRKICNSYPRKPKMYLTLNTIIYDNEINKLEKTIKNIKGKIDAVICWDFAVISLCKKYKIPFFISTQSSVSNTKAAEFYKNLGARRIVLARELNLQQIKRIGKIENLEIEVFVHGAMCVSLSGRCFTSQFLFNKSGNRGECLHPCRRTYTVKDDEKGYELKLNKNTVMSAKDLCVLPFMEKLKKMNIKSFKIEGRNRDPRYVETVVGVYRKALDINLGKEEVKRYMKELKSVYNREFSTGFYLGKPMPEDFARVENSAATTYREFLGKVTYFYPKISVALVRLANKLEKGERIVFIGEKTGAEETEVGEMEIDKKKTVKAEKGSEVGIKIGFKAKKGDEVYKIKERYQKWFA